MPKNFAHLNGLSAYDVLGVEPTATTQEIETAYRAAIKRQHSDSGGVTRLAQLVNDARDALTNHRASYDAWLQERGGAAGSAPGPTASGANPSPGTTDDIKSESNDDAGDPWQTASLRPPTTTGPRQEAAVAGFSWSDSGSTFPDEFQVHAQPYEPIEPPNPYLSSRPQIHEYMSAPPLADERRAQRQAVRLNAALTSGLLALLASLFCGPLGLWLGLRSCRSARGISISAILAILIGSVSTFYLVLAAVNQYS
jgi:hypothetical protein